MIKAVCFDFGGVYSMHQSKESSWRDMWQWFQKRIHAKISYNDFIHLQAQLDTGKINLNQFYERVFLIIGRKYTQMELKKLSRPTVPKIKLNPQIKKIVLRLKKSNYQVPLISNNINEVVGTFRRRGYYKIFSPVFISCEVGLGKNDNKLYKHVIQKLKLKPNECIMIDDNPDFVKQAKGIGMKTILYKNARQLEIELKNLHVK